MSTILRKAVPPVVILLVLIGVAIFIMSNPPEAPRQIPDDSPRITVEVIPVQPQTYRIELSSYGTVQPRTQTRLVSQVSGQVIWIKPEFKDGGFVSEGETVLRIDPRDYEADVMIAEANLLDARQNLAEEEAKAIQAREDWQRLGNEGEAPALVLRKPQLLAAEARVKSAEASLTKAKLDLERTYVKAPYNGRILSTSVDIGQVIGNNAELAEVYATDYVEIRLPICNCDLSFINLPEGGYFNADDPIDVKLYSSLGGQREWQGKIVRTEGSIDETARQLHVVAQVSDPFAISDSNQPPIKIGEYVTATIEGRKLDNVFVIPSATIYQGSYVYLVEDGVLRRQEVSIMWQNGEDALIGSGLNLGDQLVVTTLGQVTSGTRVMILGEDQKTTAAGGISPVAKSDVPDEKASESAKGSSTL